jgi:hypothetical protein
LLDELLAVLSNNCIEQQAKKRGEIAYLVVACSVVKFATGFDRTWVFSSSLTSMVCWFLLILLLQRQK